MAVLSRLGEQRSTAKDKTPLILVCGGGGGGGGGVTELKLLGIGSTWRQLPTIKVKLVLNLFLLVKTSNGNQPARESQSFETEEPTDQH